MLENGEMRWPAPPLPAPVVAPRKEEAKGKGKVPLTPEEIYADTMKSALTTSEGMSWRLGGA